MAENIQKNLPANSKQVAPKKLAQADAKVQLVSPVKVTLDQATSQANSQNEKKLIGKIVNEADKKDRQ